MNHHDEPVAPPLKAPASPPAVMGTSLRKPFSAPSCSASHVMAQAMMLESMRPSTLQTSPFSHFGSQRECPGTAGMMISGLCILSFSRCAAADLVGRSLPFPGSSDGDDGGT